MKMNQRQHFERRQGLGSKPFGAFGFKACFPTTFKLFQKKGVKQTKRTSTFKLNTHKRKKNTLKSSSCTIIHKMNMTNEHMIKDVSAKVYTTFSKGLLP